MKAVGEGKSLPRSKAIELSFKAVCDTCKQVGGNAKPLSTSSKYAQAAKRSLEGMADAIQAELSWVDWSSKKITVARGAGVLPRILWVAITATKEKVSTAPSVAICFARHGEGAVVGLMKPALTSMSKLNTVVRNGTPGMRVNVDSTKSQSSYNDKFVNPMEFLSDSFDSAAFLSHLRASLNLLEEV